MPTMLGPNAAELKLLSFVRNAMQIGAAIGYAEGKGQPLKGIDLTQPEAFAPKEFAEKINVLFDREMVEQTYALYVRIIKHFISVMDETDQKDIEDAKNFVLMDEKEFAAELQKFCLYQAKAGKSPMPMFDAVSFV